MPADDQHVPPQLDWADIRSDAAVAKHAAIVEIEGWMIPLDASSESVDYFLLAAQEPCCGGHVPRDPLTCIEVIASGPVALRAGPVRVRGRLSRLQDDPAGWRYQMIEAEAVDTRGGSTTMSRRAFLASGTALGLAACMPGRFAGYTDSQAGSETGAQAGSQANRHAASAPEASSPASSANVQTAHWQPPPDTLTIDIHSHAGRVIVSRDPAIGAHRPFKPLSAPMRAGGMNVICLAIVTDTTVTRVSDDRKRFEAWREPQPGELYALSQTEFVRANELIAREQVSVITDAATLASLGKQGPCVIISAEGADFLEGRLERVDEAYTQHRLRHLQLTHYRVNELGDIQTEPPVHGGLTDFGADVVRRCNALGIVVDVAHGTFDLVKRAASVTTKPLVLSHTALATHPGARSRLITADHARAVAGTGGVIGVWPSSGTFRDLPGMAHGMRRMVDVVGVEHVGLGTDMLGFISPPVFQSYEQLPALADALLAAGFSSAEVAQLLGDNYRRVFEASMA